MRLQRVLLLFGPPAGGFHHCHRLRKAQPRNRARPSASFISVRRFSALFDLAIDTWNQLRNAKKLAAACFRYVLQSGGCDPKSIDLLHEHEHEAHCPQSI